MLRGIVTDNADPMERGRVRVQVWGVHKEEDENLPWAEVMGSTAFPLHQGSGMAQVIPVGATVWVDFEQSDMNCPVVLGIFVGHQAETMDQANPGNSDFMGGAGSGSDYGTKATMNMPGGASITFDGKEGKTEIKMGEVGITLDSKKKTIEMSSGSTGVEISEGSVDIKNGELNAGQISSGLGGIIAGTLRRMFGF